MGRRGFRAASCRQESLTNLKKRSFRRKYGRIRVTKVSRIDSVGRSVLSFLSLGEAQASDQTADSPTGNGGGLLDLHDHARCLQLRHDREKVPERDSNQIGNTD